MEGRGRFRRIVLSGPADFPGFREATRRLLGEGVSPGDVTWEDRDQGGDLFAPEGGPQASPDPAPNRPRPVPRVPRSFLAVAEAAALHRDPERFSLLYRILWRLADEPGLLALASDPDMVRLGDWAKAVRRDIHKMHAFVRFREVVTHEGEFFIAWYEPDHHVVEAAAPFFARRFASLRWTILTPLRAAHWTGSGLVFGPGADRSAAPSGDALEDLWRSYYASVFNPARVNPGAMQAEMPVRFWRNLPEATLIPALVTSAPARAGAMVAASATEPAVRRGAMLRDSRAGTEEGAIGFEGAALQACRACPLWEHATQAVPGEGPRDAPLMLVGEQPGDEEDIAGRPFVGPAGRLLDRALAEAGIPRERVYVTNAVKHFKFEPRGRRRIHKRPAAAEIHACLPWLEREIATIGPKVVLLLGASAAQAVLGHVVSVTRERGEPMELGDGRIALITTHPSYILRLGSEEARAAAFANLVQDLGRAAAIATPPGPSASEGWI